ncbi:MAG: cell envelope integrity protein CreD [Devosiaceae bacterium]|nr:cell envelope integrity protein CreD [Devosiaceae bacterium MH13]
MTDTVLSATRRFFSAPAFKFFTLGGLTLALLIPASMIWLLVSEREERARDVAFDIAQTWGGAQTVVGPLIVVPYEIDVPANDKDDGSLRTERREAVFLPSRLDMAVEAQTQIRSRGIFDVPVYSANITFTGSFDRPRASQITADDARFLWAQSRLVLSISAVRAISDTVSVTMQPRTGIARTRAFEPSLGGSTTFAGAADQASTRTGLEAQVMAQGIHVPNLFGAQPEPFDFDVTLALNGSESLRLALVARDTTGSMTSDWPHPSFIGTALPLTSDISEAGFNARWQVPHLARSLPLAFSLHGEASTRRLTSDAFGVRFFQPADHYAAVDRALKYAILFIGIVFMAVFVIEVRTGKQVHVVQYVFVGLALVLFYVLLLSLAEHLGFATAYMIAGGATAGLIGSYCARSLGSAGYGTLILGLIGSIFGVLYLFLRLEDYALLAGSLFAFAVLAVTMFATQGVDWSGRRLMASQPPHAPSTAT